MYVYWSKTSFIRQLRDENDNGNRALQKALADVKTLQDRVNQLDEELASIAHEKTELENKQKGLTSQVEECNKKLRTTEDNLKTMTQDWEGRVKELNAKETQLRTVTTAMNEYKAKMDKFEPQVDALTKELAAAKDRIATDQKAITELEGKKNSIVKGMQDEILALKLKCLKEEGTEQAA